LAPDTFKPLEPDDTLAFEVFEVDDVKAIL